MLLVFTSSNADWLKQYLTQIDSTYGPVYPRIGVDFASRSIYNVVEAALAVQRQARKEALEKELESIVAHQEALEKSLHDRSQAEEDDYFGLWFRII